MVVTNDFLAPGFDRVDIKSASEDGIWVENKEQVVVVVVVVVDDVVVVVDNVFVLVQVVVVAVNLRFERRAK